MKNQNTENNSIKEINASTIADINELLENVYPERFDDNKEVIEKTIGFFSHEDIICNLGLMVKGIEILSLNSGAPDKNTLEVIYGLSTMIKKLLPYDEMSFIDDLILKKTQESKQKFINIHNISGN
jgi:hypothetical protein